VKKGGTLQKIRRAKEEKGYKKRGKEEGGRDGNNIKEIDEIVKKRYRERYHQ
jgi:hypothetical protein